MVACGIMGGVANQIPNAGGAQPAHCLHKTTRQPGPRRICRCVTQSADSAIESADSVFILHLLFAAIFILQILIWPGGISNVSFFAVYSDHAPICRMQFSFCRSYLLQFSFCRSYLLQFSFRRFLVSYSHSADSFWRGGGAGRGLPRPSSRR